MWGGGTGGRGACGAEWLRGSGAGGEWGRGTEGKEERDREGWALDINSCELGLYSAFTEQVWLSDLRYSAKQRPSSPAEPHGGTSLGKINCLRHYLRTLNVQPSHILCPKPLYPVAKPSDVHGSVSALWCSR